MKLEWKKLLPNSRKLVVDQIHKSRDRVMNDYEEKPRNHWANIDYYITKHNNETGDNKLVDVLELSEEEFRRFICYKLNRMDVPDRFPDAKILETAERGED